MRFTWEGKVLASHTERVAGWRRLWARLRRRPTEVTVIDRIRLEAIEVGDGGVAVERWVQPDGNCLGYYRGNPVLSEDGGVIVPGTIAVMSIADDEATL